MTRLGEIILSLFVVVALALCPLRAVILLRLISMMPARRLWMTVWFARLLFPVTILTQSPRGIRVIPISIPLVPISVVVVLIALWGMRPTILSRQIGLLFSVLTVVVQLTFLQLALGTFVDTVPPTTPTSVPIATLLVPLILVPCRVRFVLVVASVIVFGLA